MECTWWSVLDRLCRFARVKTLCLVEKNAQECFLVVGISLS